MRSAGIALAAALLATPVAHADGPGPAPSSPDLRLRELPAPTAGSLRMRPTSPAPLQAKKARAGGGGATTTATGGSNSARAADISYRPLPTDTRDLRERVIARLQAGVVSNQAGLTGDVMRTGFDPNAVTDADGNPLQATRQYLLGDAVLGSRGILLPSLNTYFLSRFRFDPDGASRYNALTEVYDARDGTDLLIRAGYASIDGLGEGVLRGLRVSGGRMFRGGAGSFVTNFDGGAAGWQTETFTVDGYVGRRVSLHDIDDPGLVGGASATAHVTAGVPLDLGVDYTYFGGIDDDAGAAVSRQAVALTSRARLGVSRVYLRGRMVDEGDGLKLGRVGGRVRHPVNDRLLVVADVEHRFKDEIAYDLLATDATDVVEARALPALGIEPPDPSTLISARADFMVTSSLEAYGFGRVNLVKDGNSRSHYTNGWQEVGAAVATTSRAVSASGQVKLRNYDLVEDANDPGTAFDDTAGSGVSRFGELSGEARYRLADRKGSAALGAYYRAYDFRSPYAEVDYDGRGGARVEADYAPTAVLRVLASYEIAQASPTLAPELSTLQSLRLIAEARF